MIERSEIDMFHKSICQWLCLHDLHQVKRWLEIEMEIPCHHLHHCNVLFSSVQHIQQDPYVYAFQGYILTFLQKEHFVCAMVHVFRQTGP